MYLFCSHRVMETLTLAAFNVPGLPKPYKQQKLIRDVTRYRIVSFKKNKS